jgi:hypothetical protein
MGFWGDFNRLLNYRIAYRIQNIFFDAYDKSQRESKRLRRAKEKEKVLRDSSKELLDLMYNNDFSKKRNSK